MNGQNIDIRWKQRFSNFKKSLIQLEEADVTTPLETLLGDKSIWAGKKPA